MTRLYLTRHGQTVWNLEGRMQGSRESALTDKGIDQALKLGKRLRDIHIDVVYSSSSERAMHTSRLIVENRVLPIIPLDELTEMNFGIWEGLTFDEIMETYGEQHHLFWNRPHLLRDFPGETFEDFKLRVVSSINRIVRENQNRDVLIVAHALVVKFIMSYFENTSLERIFDERIIQPTSLSEVEVNDNEIRIVKYGDISHY